MRQKKSYFYALLIQFFLCFSSAFAGFTEGTSIKTSSGYLAITSLQAHDVISGIDGDIKKFADVYPEAVTAKLVDTVYVIETEKVSLTVSADQLFLEASSKDFKCAGELKPGDFLVTIENEKLACISIKKVEYPTLVFDISLPYPHVFFSSPAHVVMHNSELEIALRAV